MASILICNLTIIFVIFHAKKIETSFIHSNRIHTPSHAEPLSSTRSSRVDIKIKVDAVEPKADVYWQMDYPYIWDNPTLLYILNEIVRINQGGFSFYGVLFMLHSDTRKKKALYLYSL